MKDVSIEVGNLMGCESEKLVIKSESAKNVSPCMASATVTQKTVSMFDKFDMLLK